MAKQALNILLIEDSPDDRLILRGAIRQFSRAGTRICETESGEAGLAACSTSTTPFDMILLDLILPDMHGLDVLDALRGSRKLVPYPVIVLTGHGQDNDAEAALQMGALDFIAKDNLMPSGLLRIIYNGIERFQLMQHLQASEMRYRTLAAVAPVGIFRTELNGDCLYVNDRWCEFAGMPAADALGKGWLAAIHADDRAAITTAWYNAAQQQEIFQSEYRFQRPNGDVIWVYGQADLEFDQNQNVIGYIGTLTDITERKLFENTLQNLNQNLEQQVNERTAELMRSNTELDKFVYVASHDLKAPLQAIDHIAQWVIEDVQGMIPFKSQEHLLKLRQRVKRMEKLLEDLLIYSRAGRLNGNLAVVVFDKLMTDIITLLLPESAFKITCQTNTPKFITYRTPLEVVLRNLIGNAMKHHHRSDGHIHIQASAEGDGLHFSVADDGPGIAPEFHERIFGIFQTLQPRDVVEGSGIGLSIVKKTVESLGGEISIESASSQGSTFRFTWPMHKPL